MNYYKLLINNINEKKEKIFCVIDDIKYMYKDIINEINRISYKIKLLQIDDKKTVFIYSKNPLFQIILFFSLELINLIPVILHYGLSEELIEELMNNNQVELLITDNKENTLNTFKIDNGLFIYKNKVGDKKHFLKASMGALTSGTTGIPKVLYRTFKSWYDFFEVQNQVFSIKNESVVFISGDFSFTGNLNVILSVVYSNATIVINSKLLPKKWIDDILKYKVTNIYLLPTKLNLLSKVLDSYIVGVECIFTGSEFLKSNTANMLSDIFIDAKIIIYYGASELSYITYANYEDIKHKNMCVGKPFRNIKVWIKENCIFVDTIFNVINIEKPFTVKDKGYIDEDGDLILLGRGSDIINVAGIKINVLKIQETIKKLNSIYDVYVTFRSNNLRNNEIIAFIIKKENIENRNIISDLHKVLSKAEIPNKIVYIKEIPLKTSGKVNRNELLNMLN